MKMPVLFVSHGAPTIVIDESPARRFLEGYAAALPRPRAILVVSAHFERPIATLTGAAAPATIHDFGGFPAELYAMRYPAPGDPALAARAADLIRAAGLPVAIDPTHGLDHGVWTPLSLLYPDADIPVVALSVDPSRGPSAQLAVGRALAPLRDEGVLIVGSGAATHNLRAFFQGGFAATAPPPRWVEDFVAWLARAIEEGRTDDLVSYRDRAPYGRENHPTEEHILPLFTALGAAGGPGVRAHASIDHGVLAMDAYAFTGA
jgi:4,5-DOPA dioxygenase extradiol